MLINNKSLLDINYPIGSIFLSIDTQSPAMIFGGVWEELGDNLALWAVSTLSGGAGNTISAGLPNITGNYIWSVRDGGGSGFNRSTYINGAFAPGTSLGSNNASSDTSIQSVVQGTFNASRSNAIYGNSQTVQPPAIKVYAWKRVE